MKAKALLGAAKLFFKKNGPTIMIVAGSAGCVGATVLACRATRKIDEKVGPHLTEIAEIREDEDHTKGELVKVYASTGVAVAKTYAIPAVLMTASLGSIIFSHRMMLKKTAALGESLALTTAAFNEYRQRVIADLGEEKDKEYLYGTKSKKITEEYTDEDGKTKKKKVPVQVLEDKNVMSPYARIFDSSNDKWYDEDFYYNLQMLKTTQANWNNILKLEGHVFLNQVLRDLGFETTEVGQYVGWIYDESKNDGTDNYIDFGMSTMMMPCEHGGIPGYEKVIALDFNVDGTIIENAWGKKPQTENSTKVTYDVEAVEVTT